MSDFELDTRYTLIAPKGTISASGMHEIIRFIQSQRLQEGEWKERNPDWKSMFLPPLPNDWEWIWLVTGKGEYVGTFPKRESKFYYKEHGIKVTNAFMSQIGNLARANSEHSVQYDFDFADRFDWTSGEFGDGTSCFFGGRSQALVVLQDNGAMAMRFYGDRGRGLARAWLVLISPKVYVVFNGYGFRGNPTLVIARVLATFLNVHYKKIKLCNDGDVDQVMWINGDIGYTVGKIEDIDHITEYSLDWDVPYHEQCHNCGDDLDEFHQYTGADDERYCDHCYCELFDDCCHCGEVHWQDDITYACDEYVCEYCLERLFARCDACDEWHYKRDVWEIDERTVCRDCVVDVMDE